MNFRQTYRKAVNAFASLPGIGRKTALRLVYTGQTTAGGSGTVAQAMINMRRNIRGVRTLPQYFR